MQKHSASNRSYLDEYRALGIRTLPVTQNKKPYRTNWQSTPLNERWERRFPNAGIGMLCGEVVTVVDIDEPKLLDRAREAFGETPIEVQTRRGFHLWYRANGEQGARHWRDGERRGGEVRGLGVYTVVPNSIGYTFLSGRLAAVPDLPTIRDDARAMFEAARIEQKGPSKARSPLLDAVGQAWREMREGDGRDNALFDLACSLAEHADSYESLVAQLHAANALFAEPMSEGEVKDRATSAWKYRLRGTLPGSDEYYRTMERLLQEPDAYLILADLRRNHGWKDGEEFALANTAAKRYGIGRPRFLHAVRVLADFGYIEITHPGGSGRHDPRKARLKLS